MKTYKLAVANEMYRFAFQVKRHQFSKKFSRLTEKELHKRTTAHFVSLPKEDERPYFRSWLTRIGLNCTGEK